MPHLIEPYFDVSYTTAYNQINEAHRFLATRANDAMLQVIRNDSQWGIQTKRLVVNLAGEDVPDGIGKEQEKYTEIVNIAATIERLLSLIHWFSEQPDYCRLRIRECHPSTSDEHDGDDLVLEDATHRVAVRCEVCDIVSSKASTNGKEKSDINKLGCDVIVPRDGTLRFICTSSEFADALCNPRRRWIGRHYRYERLSLGDCGNTCLLRVVTAGE